MSSPQGAVPAPWGSINARRTGAGAAMTQPNLHHEFDLVAVGTGTGFTDAAVFAAVSAALGPPLGAGQTRALLKPIETILSDAPRAVRAHFLAATKEALRLDAAPVKPARKPRIVRARPPDGLRTKAEAAAKLGCSIRTLDGHIDAGELRYVIIGHGKKRPRKMIADADLDQFIANQTRKDSPCPSDATHDRRSTSTISRSNVFAFSALQKRPRSAKPKP
jgi:hypothetical protein